MAQAENRLERLANVFDANTSAFSDGMKVLESMNFVFQRVLNDMQNGTVRCVGDKPLEEGQDPMLTQPVRVGVPLHINFQSYVQEYWTCMLMADFAVWCKSIHKPTVLIEAPSKDDVIEFGG